MQIDNKEIGFSDESAIKSDVIGVFPVNSKVSVLIETPEFSAVCPFSGLPDIGNLTITYVPNGVCVELKSLKYYLLSFRSVGIYQELATIRIAKDLAVALNTTVKVVLVYNTRGGINTTTEYISDGGN